jgi:hypothetical protein
MTPESNQKVLAGQCPRLLEQTHIEDHVACSLTEVLSYVSEAALLLQQKLWQGLNRPVVLVYIIVADLLDRYR